MAELDEQPFSLASIALLYLTLQLSKTKTAEPTLGRRHTHRTRPNGDMIKEVFTASRPSDQQRSLPTDRSSFCPPCYPPLFLEVLHIIRIADRRAPADCPAAQHLHSCDLIY
jgi:hypothetical protein